MEQVARVEPVLTLARFKSATALRDGACAYLLAAEKRSRHATIVIFFHNSRQWLSWHFGGVIQQANLSSLL